MDAFEQVAAGRRRGNVFRRLPDAGGQALDWLEACRGQGLIVRENGRHRFLHQLLFQYLAAYGLAMQSAKGRLRAKPGGRCSTP